MKKTRTLVLLSVVLAIIVITLGAYTRLTHAGLGCPDWPGCYGHLDVPKTAQEIERAEQAFPERPVETQKAWNEMIHRYFAGTLGLFIATIFIIGLRMRNQGMPLYLPLALLATVTFQAALGMWTVTLKLMPVIVMAHLLGGFITLCLLYLLYLRLTPYTIESGNKNLRQYSIYGVIGIVILASQIALGGWTSSNYAALACTELPICQSGWQQQLTFENSFDLVPPKRDTYEFGFLNHAERVTIHAMHRIGAIVTSVYLIWLALFILSRTSSRFFQRNALAVLAILAIQVSLGVSNIVFNLPLPVAVAHNVVAALLMLSLITLTYSLRRRVKE
ncbi:COX15/CtaA family protein [Thalassotalea ponticola]|uniref:COX15/CtaA family protein n=1 Tax=Thalassotalea ponticola TaxID=1523392 RepID=UPI0025B5D262|nr:COX15/CtaA family protein [Thalassotalea ponticola]MDN3652287.1 COX15/CtaA family protein [Thalassotalea ponticola]